MTGEQQLRGGRETAYRDLCSAFTSPHRDGRAAVNTGSGQLLHMTRWLATIVSLVLGALLAALIQGRPHYQLLACVSLLPLFLAIRTQRSAGAAVCGALWGGCLAYFCHLTDLSSALPSSLSVVTVVAAPAIYAGLAARLSAVIGFNPLILGLGWVLVETALASAGFPRGVLAATSSAYPVLAHISHLLGYLFVAFLGAWANASLLAIFRRIRIAIPAQYQLVRRPGNSWSASHPARPCASLAVSLPWLPRAPPMILPL